MNSQKIDLIRNKTRNFFPFFFPYFFLNVHTPLNNLTFGTQRGQCHVFIAEALLWVVNYEEI